MPSPADTETVSARREFKRYFRYARTDLPWFLLECVLLLLISASNTLMIWLIGKPFNLIEQHQYEQISQLALLFIALMLFNQLCHFADVTLTDWLGLRFVGRLRKTLFEKLLQLQHPLALRFERGDLLVRLNQDVWRVHDWVVITPTLAVSALSIIVFYASMLVWIDPWLALAALAISPVYYLHQRLFGPPQRRLSSRFFDLEARLQSYEQQSLEHVMAISSFNADASVRDQHAGLFARYFTTAFRRTRLTGLFRTTLSALIYLTGAGIVTMGVWRIQQGALTPGHLISFLVFLGYLSVPMRTLANMRFANQGHVASAARISDVFALQPFVQSPAQPVAWTTRSGGIEFDSVRFSYPDGKPVFNDISVSIDAGETIALVGPSGAGKSTFAQLLLRFYDPDSGTIRVDGVDIKQFALSTLRENIAVCWQQGLMLPGTIRANLALSRPAADEAHMIEACKQAQAWDFIQSLPKGLDSDWLEAGMNFSAGQIQRLHLAQALLRDSPILILDEASSALDSDTEKRLSEALDSARAGRTTLLIAHRYSSLRRARRVIYFDGHGGITVSEHEALYATHSAYRSAVDWQMQLNVK